MFKGETWKTSINVNDFINNNYKEYLKDESFLESTTPKTDKLILIQIILLE